MATRSRSFGAFSFATFAYWRQFNQRYAFLIFVLLSIGLMIVGKAKPAIVESFRSSTIDGLAPILDVVTRPVLFADKIIDAGRDIIALRGENERLRADYARLAEWQNSAITLQNENRELRNLLKFKTEPGLAYISARVIADTGGPFARGLIVTAGKTDGVKVGMAAVTGDGLVGRVVEAGDWSSRILLITDLNSRIPVLIPGSGDRAILAGDNSSEPKLLFMPRDATIADDARVVTSGHGGIFPPNLMIGTVIEKDGVYKVSPIADLGRVTYVRLVDFDLKGGNFNPIVTRLQSETKKR